MGGTVTRLPRSRPGRSADSGISLSRSRGKRRRDLRSQGRPQPGGQVTVCWAQAAYWSGTFAGLVLAYGVVLSCSLEITKELVCIYCQEKTTGFINQENNVRATSYSPSEWEVRLGMQATSYSPSGDCESMQARMSANSVDFQERCQC